MFSVKVLGKRPRRNSKSPVEESFLTSRCGYDQMRHPVLSEREWLSKVASRRVVLSVLLSVVAFGLGTGFGPAVAATTTAGPTIIPMAHMDVSEPLIAERAGDDHHHNDAKPHRPVPEGRRLQQSEHDKAVDWVQISL